MMGEHDSEKMKKANEELRVAEEKLAGDKAKVPELSRAVASARRTKYRVDKFTREIETSFGRVNHG
jgi:hypothetical protein